MKRLAEGKRKTVDELTLIKEQEKTKKHMLVPKIAGYMPDEVVEYCTFKKEVDFRNYFMIFVIHSLTVGILVVETKKIIVPKIRRISITFWNSIKITVYIDNNPISDDIITLKHDHFEHTIYLSTLNFNRSYSCNFEWSLLKVLKSKDDFKLSISLSASTFLSRIY